VRDAEGQAVKVSRRGFLALASGLLVAAPEPVRRYFFAPAAGWAARWKIGPSGKVLTFHSPEEVERYFGVDSPAAVAARTAERRFQGAIRRIEIIGTVSV
jgi:hypothetical protein